jgi:hypothetical protein
MPAIGCSRCSSPSGTGRLIVRNAMPLVSSEKPCLAMSASEVARSKGSRPACGVGSGNPPGFTLLRRARGLNKAGCFVGHANSPFSA